MGVVMMVTTGMSVINGKNAIDKIDSDDHAYVARFNAFEQTSANIGALLRDLHSFSLEAQLGNKTAFFQMAITLRTINLYTTLLIPQNVQQRINVLQGETFTFLDKIKMEQFNRTKSQPILYDEMMIILQWEKLTVCALIVSGLLMPVEKIVTKDPFKGLIPD